jgi:methyl-accepting chemotaxis protein
MIFMVCFGLFMGIVFPFYSFIFFGSAAFTPLYVFGCLVAGITVGSFCYYVIRQVLHLNLERQWQSLSRISGSLNHEYLSDKYDDLQALMATNELMMKKILDMVDNVSLLINKITPHHQEFSHNYQEMTQISTTLTAKGEETVTAVVAMNNFFSQLIQEIEDLTKRAEEKTSISTEMTSATDTIADTIRSYSASVLETSASIEEMAMSIKETAASIDALAGSTEQTVSSITQIGAAIGNVRDNASKSAQHSEDVRMQAKEGITAMAATLKAMREIEQANDEAFESINRLSVHSARVGEFLKVIQDVVSQTNLLSLNASIIAAQAGEQGKSFAVVAEEIRSLAQRTSLSAREIDDLVKNIQMETAAVQRTVTQGKNRVKEGVKISGHTNDALVRIEAGASEASEMVQMIASATMEQAAGSRLILEEAEKNLDRVKQATIETQKQEQGITLIIKALEQMRLLSQNINSSTQEQAKGNRLYLKSVLEDSDRIRKMRDTCIQQIMMGDVLLNYVREAGVLIEKNAQDSRHNMIEIEEISKLTAELKQEIAPFKTA